MAEMSVLERWLVNSPSRAWFQRGEVDAFIRWSRVSSSAHVLDLGCARGVSTELIVRKLRPRRLEAFDLDPSMIEAARKRLSRVLEDGTLALRVADAAEMPYEDASFDAVFESGLLHHVSDWRGALREVGRLLRAGGSFCFAEPSPGRPKKGIYRLLPHAVESMFSAEELRSALAEAGLPVQEPLRRLPLWGLCGVAGKEVRRSAVAPTTRVTGREALRWKLLN